VGREVRILSALDALVQLPGRPSLPVENEILGTNVSSTPKLQALNRFYLPVIRAVQIPFSSTDMRMTHQSLDRSEVIPVIQEGGSERMPHYMRMNPLRISAFFTTDLMRQSTAFAVRDLASYGPCFPKVRNRRCPGSVPFRVAFRYSFMARKVPVFRGIRLNFWPFPITSTAGWLR
jgi:hypothetical protein